MKSMSESGASPSVDPDRQSRRLLNAVQHPLEQFLEVDRLDQELVGNLYLRLRDALTQWQSRDGLRSLVDDALFDELALIVYLTAGAWRSSCGADGTIQVLASLQQSIAAAFEPRTAAESITRQEGEHHV